jgi:hypothetical protein
MMNMPWKTKTKEKTIQQMDDEVMVLDECSFTTRMQNLVILIMLAVFALGTVDYPINAPDNADLNTVLQIAMCLLLLMLASLSLSAKTSITFSTGSKSFRVVRLARQKSKQTEKKIASTEVLILRVIGPDAISLRASVYIHLPGFGDVLIDHLDEVSEIPSAIKRLVEVYSLTSVSHVEM